MAVPDFPLLRPVPSAARLAVSTGVFSTILRKAYEQALFAPPNVAIDALLKRLG
jgi:hypothetical protein